MTSHDQVWVQLATCIPRKLHRAVKEHCVRVDRSLMDFVVDALAERLEHEGVRGTRRRLRA